MIETLLLRLLIRLARELVFHSARHNLGVQHLFEARIVLVLVTWLLLHCFLRAEILRVLHVFVAGVDVDVAVLANCVLHYLLFRILDFSFLSLQIQGFLKHTSMCDGRNRSLFFFFFILKLSGDLEEDLLLLVLDLAEASVDFIHLTQ